MSHATLWFGGGDDTATMGRLRGHVDDCHGRVQRSREPAVCDGRSGGHVCGFGRVVQMDRSVR